MQRFKNILVVNNNAVGDEATLSRATALAMRNNARLTVAEVLEEPERLTVSDVLGVDVRNKIVEQRRFHLDRVITSVRNEGVQARATVLVGTPFLEITREVLRHEHDLVMITAEGPLGLKKLLFGSTSMHLMRKCPCPIWVTKRQPKSYAGILVAIDLSSPTSEKEQLNRTVLQLSSSLARIEHSELHVVHAWELSGNDLATSRSEITPEIMDTLIKRNEAPRRKRLEALLAELDLEDLAHQVHLVQGRPESAIPELAQKEKIELIVMGSVGRTGIPGYFIGNTAETVLQQVDCAVLTVKPAGFVTPITDEAGLQIQPRQNATD